MSKKQKMDAFMINDLLKFNIDELVTFIEENYPSVDIFNIKRTYVHIQPNGSKIEQILINFIINKINELGEGGDDITECVNNNIDIFFDITPKSNNEVFIIERTTSN